MALNIFSLPTLRIQTPSIPAPTVSSGVMERIPVSANESLTCSICWDPITEISLRLPCRHSFHESCIQRWLDTNASCPVCRHRLAPEPEEEEEPEPTHAHRIFHIDQSLLPDMLQYKIKIKFMDPVYHTGHILTKWKMQDTIEDLFQFLDPFVHLQEDYFLKIEQRVIKKNNSLNLMNTPISYFIRPSMLRIHEIEVHPEFQH